MGYLSIGSDIQEETRRDEITNTIEYVHDAIQEIWRGKNPPRGKRKAKGRKKGEGASHPIHGRVKLHVFGILFPARDAEYTPYCLMSLPRLIN